MSEYRNEGPRLQADGDETSPAKRREDERSAAASPDEATQRDEIRRFINLLIVATLSGGLFDGIAAIAIDNPRWFATVIVAAVLATWLAAVPRRAIDRKSIGTVVSQVAIVLTGAIVVVAFVQPFLALVLAPATLLPIALGLPYLAGRSFRHLMGSAWAAAVVIILASLLPDDAVHSSAVVTIVQLWALAVVIGLVFFLLYRSAEGLKASGREFRRLFQLSSDLAETTDAGVLGELVARHLAEATGFDDCVIYALAADGGRLVPFGSHPVERSLEAAPEPLAKRPMLERVANDQAPIVIDVSDERADPLERDRLRVLGRRAMLLLPLSAHDKPVGIAELTSAAPHSIDVRRLALARTLTFEAAMAIENGRLYQELRDRSLHDPLTGLANRSLLYDRAEHALARQARKDGAGVAVLFMDIDDFKTINDTLGHARGDRLLTILGERLRTVARAADTVARLGGDEFALLLEDVSSADAALAVAARVIDALAPSFDLAGQPTRASVSIGVAFRSAQGTSFDDLLKDADAAMYEAKAAGKGRTVLSAGGRIALSKGPRLRADTDETSPAKRREDERSVAASPDDAIQRVEVRQFINLLIVTALVTMLIDGIPAIAIDIPRWFGPVIVAGLFATWLAAGPRRAIDHEPVDVIVSRVAIVLIAWILAVALFQPFLALALAPAYLVPVALGLPYLEGRKLRLVMGSAWAAAVGSALLHLLPDDSSVPAALTTLVEIVALSVTIGVVFIVLYRSAEGLKASGREFRRLFQLSSDLAETTDAGVLGELVARHLAEATGFDDCVIYALAADGGRLVPFGSHPVERSLEAAPEPLAKRPMLERVANDQAPIVIDVSDERADPLERDRLRVLGRRAMLLLPLSAHDKPVGIAELTSAAPHSIDVRRLALARTLTFEAAMAIENGRLYQELRDRSLHDPLTGLANRSLLYDRAEHALARQARKDGAGVAVLFMDIDDFKTINDTLGHARGDRLLTILGERLRTVARAADTVARLGGDEFALLLEDVSSADAALAVAARVIDALAPSFDLAGQPTRASVSIGVAFRSAQGTSFDDLLKDADAAMYEAKAAGKGRTVLSAGGRIAQDLGRALPPAK